MARKTKLSLKMALNTPKTPFRLSSYSRGKSNAKRCIESRHSDQKKASTYVGAFFIQSEGLAWNHDTVMHGTNHSGAHFLRHLIYPIISLILRSTSVSSARGLLVEHPDVERKIRELIG